MKIEVIGVGAGFSPQLGNSSFLVWDDSLKSAVLFDCGYQVYSDLVYREQYEKRSIIDKIDTVFISHHHADHSGSLANLIMHRFWINGLQTKIVGVDCETYFKLTGTTKEAIRREYDDRFYFYPTKHTSDIESYACVFEKKLFYSGDTAESLLETDFAKSAEIIIHEACLNGYGVHTSIEDLKLADEEIRKKTYLIHFPFSKIQKLNELAIKYGFSVLDLRNRWIYL